MPEITTDGKPLDVNAAINIGAMQIPGFRTLVAVEKGVQHKVLIQVKGGIGDYICAEPSIRYACNTFKDTQVYVATYTPEFYTHLPLAQVFDLTGDHPKWEDYFCFSTISVGDELGCQFLTHLYSQVVDYHSLTMFRMQLEPEEKCVQLPNDENANRLAESLIKKDTDVLIHAGRTWQSRTFPKVWWDEVIAQVRNLGARPVLIGAESLNNCGTVDVDSEDCHDLRGRLSLTESIAVTRTARVLLTNDSSPLHMAASGTCWIGYLSTVRKPGTLLHYRDGGKLGYRMQNLSKGNFISEMDLRMSNPDLIRFNLADPTPWLPTPLSCAEWAVDKLKNGG